MIALLARIQAANEQARLRFVKFLNRVAAGLSTALLAFNAAYPEAIQSAGLPPWALIPAGIAWFLLIEYVTKQRCQNPA